MPFEAQIYRIAEHQYRVVGQHFGYSERRDRGNKHHRDPADYSRQRQRQSRFKEGFPRSRAQIFCRLGIAGIDIRNRGMQRHYHIRNKVIYHAYNDRTDAQTYIHSVENGFHRVSSDQEVDPHRQDHQQNYYRTRRPFGNYIRQRIADQQAQRRRYRAYRKGHSQNAKAGRVGKERCEVTEGKITLGIQKRVYQQHDQRRHDKHQHKQNVRIGEHPPGQAEFFNLAYSLLEKLFCLHYSASAFLISSIISFSGATEIPTLSPFSQSSSVSTKKSKWLSALMMH